MKIQMARKPTTVKLDEHLWREVRLMCVDFQMQPSDYLEGLIDKDFRGNDQTVWWDCEHDIELFSQGVMEKRNSTPTSGQLLRSIDVILHEIMTMEETLRDATRTISDEDRRYLRRQTTELRRRAEELMNWLTEARLELTKQ